MTADKETEDLGAEMNARLAMQAEIGALVIKLGEAVVHYTEQAALLAQLIEVVKATIAQDEARLVKAKAAFAEIATRLTQRRGTTVAKGKTLLTESEARLAESDALLARMAANACERAKRRFERGDKGAILEAGFECANANTLLPNWARDAFIRAYMETVIGPPLHRSWDEVFGKPHDKKDHKLYAKFQAQKLLFPVYVSVLDARAKNPRKDVFESVGKKFGIGKSHCKKYFNNTHKLATSKNTAPMAKWLIEDARRRYGLLK
jgi:hypothetical protein